MQSTKERILNAAEALFAEQGLAEASMRAITRQAAANLAAVNYHFGSKDALIEAVFSRCVAVINRQRREYLQQAMIHANGQANLEAVLDAYIRPALISQSAGASNYIKLLGRAYTDPHRHERYLPQQDDAIFEVFMPEFSRLLPNLDKLRLYWCCHFLVGALAYCMAGEKAMRMSSTYPLCDPANAEDMVKYLVQFTAAGMRGA